jgi:integrating conjugative element protein (TIGR03759 family)
MSIEKVVVLRGNKLNKIRAVVILSFIGLSLSVSANDSFDTSKVITSAESALNDKQLDAYFNVLTPLDIARAKSWGLTGKEWSTFKKLKMTSSRAALVPNIDPITLLGAESKTDKERSRYAKLFNDMEIKRSIEDIAFAYAQNADIQKRVPDSNVFKSSVEKRSIRKADYLDGIAKRNETPDEYVAFIDLKEKCGGGCQVQIDQVTTGNNFVHFYFINAKEDSELFAFVNDHTINPEKIQNGTYTLNYPEKDPDKFTGAVKVELLSVYQEKYQ